MCQYLIITEYQILVMSIFINPNQWLVNNISQVNMKSNTILSSHQVKQAHIDSGPKSVKQIRSAKSKQDGSHWDDCHAENYNTGRWTEEECKQFVVLYQQYGKNWKSIAEFIPTRNSQQVRSHAQKFLSRKNRKQDDQDAIRKAKQAIQKEGACLRLRSRQKTGHHYLNLAKLQRSEQDQSKRSKRRVRKVNNHLQSGQSISRPNAGSHNKQKTIHKEQGFVMSKGSYFRRYVRQDSKNEHTIYPNLQLNSKQITEPRQPKRKPVIVLIYNP